MISALLLFQLPCSPGDQKPGQTAAEDAEQEGEQGEEDNGEGAEVVHHLREVDVPGVEHGGPGPGVHTDQGVQHPHAVHRSRGGH